MKTDSTDAAWAAARAAEPSSMTRDEIAGLLTDVRRARSCLDAIEVHEEIRVLAVPGGQPGSDRAHARQQNLTGEDRARLRAEGKEDDPAGVEIDVDRQQQRFTE